MDEHPAAVLLDTVSVIISYAIAPTMMIWAGATETPCDRKSLSFQDHPGLDTSCSEQAEWTVSMPIVQGEQQEYAGIGTTSLCTTCLLSILNSSPELLHQNHERD